MYALARDGVEVGRQDGDKGFAFAGLHLGYAALMEHNAADELDAEGLHAQNAPRRLAHGRKGLRQQVVQILAVCIALLELRGLGLELLVGQGLHLRLQRLYLVNNRVYSLQLVVAVRTKKLAHDPHIVAYLHSC